MRMASLAAAGFSRYWPRVARPTAAVPSTNALPTARRCQPTNGTASVKASGTASQVRSRNSSCRQTGQSLVYRPVKSKKAGTAAARIAAPLRK